jgi:hypothetical protein
MKKKSGRHQNVKKMERNPMVFSFATQFRPALVVLMMLTGGVQNAAAQNLPKIAVTDLSYEEKVSHYFSFYHATEKISDRSSSKERYRDSDFSSSGSAANKQNYQAERSTTAATGEVTTIDRGELRKFTADIKGELLKSGSYRLVQGRPWTQTNTEKLYDIINRIKKGYYAGADYVLFGSINNIEFRNEANPIQGSDATNYSLSLELVGEFSLINTKTYEIKAAFSAAGEGTDARLVNMPGQRISLKRGKVMQEVSRSLGEAVAAELEGQFNPSALRRSTSVSESREVIQRDKTIIFK